MIKEENINCTIEALILASPEPVAVKKLCDVIGDISPARVRQGICDLNNVYMGCGCSFRIREIAGGYQVHILPDFEQPIKKMLSRQRTVRLTRAALETLAIIAYKQPVTKTDIEHIRGVASDGVIHNLLERKLILITGRADTPGRPLLYKTSQEFLKFFGLNRLSDLPRMDEIEDMIRQSEEPKEQTVLQLGDNGNSEGTGPIILPETESDILEESEENALAVSMKVSASDNDDSHDVDESEKTSETIEDSQAESSDTSDDDDKLPRTVQDTKMFGTDIDDISVLDETADSEKEIEISSGFTLPTARFEAEHLPVENDKEKEPAQEHAEDRLLADILAEYEPIPDDPPPLRFDTADAETDDEPR